MFKENPEVAKIKNQQQSPSGLNLRSSLQKCKNSQIKCDKLASTLPPKPKEILQKLTLPPEQQKKLLELTKKSLEPNKELKEALKSPIQKLRDRVDLMAETADPKDLGVKDSAVLLGGISLDPLPIFIGARSVQYNKTLDGAFGGGMPLMEGEKKGIISYLHLYNPELLKQKMFDHDTAVGGVIGKDGPLEIRVTYNPAVEKSSEGVSFDITKRLSLFDQKGELRLTMSTDSTLSAATKMKIKKGDSEHIVGASTTVSQKDKWKAYNLSYDFNFDLVKGQSGALGAQAFLLKLPDSKVPNYNVTFNLTLKFH